MRAPLVAAGLLMVLRPALAEAGSYFPLQVGNQWIYSSVGGLYETLTITGTAVIRGRETFVLRYGPSLHNEGLENYWSTSPDGDVLLHGFNRTVEGFSAQYEPPIALLDAPPALDKTWSQLFAVNSPPDTALGTPFPIAFRIFEAGTLAVPAGSFYAYGVGQVAAGAMSIASVGTVSLTGVRISAGSATDWWSEGIGLVRYSTDDDYRLESFTGPTPTDAITWGGVKALYRR